MAANKTQVRADKLRELVLQYASQQKNATFNYRQTAHALNLTYHDAQREVALALADLAFDELLVEVAPGKYKYPSRGTTAVGTFQRRSNGKNSVLIDGDEDGETLFVAEHNSMHALNGDRVRVNIAARRPGQEAEAEVVEIIEKKDQVFIGELSIGKDGATLRTDSRFLANDISIRRGKTGGGKTGDKAVVRIVDWPDYRKDPIGEVVDILGRKGENDTEIHAILAEYGLPYRYPAAVEKAAQKITAGITPEVIAKRIDMRDVTTFTIDPKDAKDFDDALSLQKLPNGNFQVGVHIADVTHYVAAGSVLDREAEKRATSVYLVDRVVPMLPEHLSNGICSLRPNEEKLTFSAIFEITPAGKVVDTKIGRTVIRSDRRFTYEEAQQVIETGTGDFAEEILTLDRLAKIFRTKRFKNGSVDFDRVEVRFDIAPDGHPVNVYFKESKDSNKLIEEFMLLANKAVAQFVGEPPKNRKPKAFVYRIHDTPDKQRLDDLAQIASSFGYRLKTKGTMRDVNRSLNQMLADVKGRPEENLLSTLAIRAMAKAVYSTTNVGHYGLGFPFYTHFTSPIRRYPDMMVHRLLARYLGGRSSADAERLEEQCKHSSDMEQLASNAERSSIKFKQVEYMADHLDEEYEGVISGVTEWGLYVELNANKCEGLIPIRDLADDYYDLDEKNYCLVGRRNNVRFRLGDKVKVKVARADIEKRQLDFALVEPALMRRKQPGEDNLGFIRPDFHRAKKPKRQRKSLTSFKKGNR